MQPALSTLECAAKRGFFGRGQLARRTLAGVAAGKPTWSPTPMRHVRHVRHVRHDPSITRRIRPSRLEAATIYQRPRQP